MKICLSLFVFILLNMVVFGQSQDENNREQDLAMSLRNSKVSELNEVKSKSVDKLSYKLICGEKGLYNAKLIGRQGLPLANVLYNKELKKAQSIELNVSKEGLLPGNYFLIVERDGFQDVVTKIKIK